MRQDNPSHRSIGDAGERIAIEYLEGRGYTIVECNYQIKGGEIDIITRLGAFTIFTEVRYRRNEDYGHPLDTFSYTKKKTLKRTIMMYLSKHKINPEYTRIDFIGIMPKTHAPGYDIWHIEGIDL